MGTRKSTQAQRIDGRAIPTARERSVPAPMARQERAALPRAQRVLVASPTAQPSPPTASHAKRLPTASAAPARLAAGAGVAAKASRQPVDEPIVLFPAGQSATASARPRRQRFGELREALAGGWEIVQPIFARPLWSAPDDSKTAFNFVLSGPRGMRLVTVPEGRLVERFIRAHQLAVDYVR